MTPVRVGALESRLSFLAIADFASGSARSDGSRMTLIGHPHSFSEL